MACKMCGFENLVNLKSEITASFPHIEDAKAAPIYFTQDLDICLKCGFAALSVPEAQLEVLRKKKVTHS